MFSIRSTPAASLVAASLLLAAGLAAPVTASAGELRLQNDDFDEESENAIGYPQGGFVADECWASVYVPEPEDYPFEIDTIQVFISGEPGDTTQEIFVFQIWDVDSSNMPVSKRDEEAVQLSASTSYLNEIVVADFKFDASVTTIESGNFAIAICLYDHSGYPAIVRDDGMDYPDRNWIQLNSGLWVQSSQYLLDGDWIQRVIVEGDNISGGIDGGDDTGDPGGDDTGPVASGDLDLISITPSVAIEGESTEVVFLGSGFAAGAEARIGGIAITGQSIVNGETITGLSPTSLPAGVHDVEVVSDDGESAYLAAAFTVQGGGCGGCGGAAPVGGLAWLLALGVTGMRRRG